jgi:hypothetical protein
MVPGARDPKNRILGGWVASINNYESYNLSSVVTNDEEMRELNGRETPLVTWYVTVGSDGLKKPFRRDPVVMKTYCRKLQYAASTISPPKSERSSVLERFIWTPWQGYPIIHQKEHEHEQHIGLKPHEVRGWTNQPFPKHTKWAVFKQSGLNS